MRPVFDKSLRKVVKPVLEQHAFVFNGSRDFTKQVGGKEFKVNFQLGQRGMEGKFTVNLIIEGESERLGCVRVTRWSRSMDLLFGEYDPWWKGILMPKDKWWKLDDIDAYMNQTMRKVLLMLEAHGLPWLQRHAT